MFKPAGTVTGLYREDANYGLNPELVPYRDVYRSPAPSAVMGSETQFDVNDSYEQYVRANKNVWWHKTPITGLLDRNGDYQPHGAPISAAYSNIVLPVIQIYWSDLQASTLGPLTGNGTNGTSQIDAAITAGIPFKLRLLCGSRAPSDAKTLFDGTPPTLTDGTTVFPISMVDQQGSNVGAWGTVGAFWTGGSYRNALYDLYRRLAAYKPNGGTVTLDAHPLLRDLTFSEPSTIYAEFGKRQLVDTNQPGGENAAVILQLIAAGFTSGLDQTEIRLTISDCIGLVAFTPLSLAYNPYESLNKKTGPRSITASGATTITTSGTPWGVNDYQNHSCAVVRGRYRITGVAANVVTCASAAFSALTANENCWIAGVMYTVTSFTATQLTLNASPPANTNGSVVILWPAGLAGVAASYNSYGSFAVTSNTSSVLTVTSGASSANALVGLELYTMNENNSETITFGYMGNSRLNQPLPETVETNNGIRSTSVLQPGGASGVTVYQDMQLTGKPLGGQTAGTALINGTDTSTARPLKTLIENAIAAGYIYIEMPSDYNLIYTSTSSTLSASNAGTPTQFTVQGSPSPAWSLDDWGIATSFLYGILKFPASGNQYYGSNHAVASRFDIFQQVGTPGQTSLLAADQSAGLSYTVESPDYLTPAECAAYNARLAANL